MANIPIPKTYSKSVLYFLKTGKDIKTHIDRLKHKSDPDYLEDLRPKILDSYEYNIHIHISGVELKNKIHKVWEEHINKMRDICD